MIFLLLLISYSLAFSFDIDCEYPRNMTIACLFEFGDVNKDEKLSYIELKTTIERDLARWKQWIIPSTTNIMKSCDYDNDGFVSKEDMKHNNGTCLTSCLESKVAYKNICEYERKGI
jgi:hypothetical protein